MKSKLNIIGILVFLFGLSLTIVSFSYDRYSDESAFNKKYMEIDYDDEKFYELREEYLTSKDDYFDYGITFVICGLGTILLSVIGIKKIRTPSKRWIIVFVGLLAAITTTIASVVDLFMEVFRGSCPHWADSIGIPLLRVPFILIIFLIWVGFNSIGLMKPFNTSVLISTIKIAKVNRWYLIIAILSLLITIWSVVSGFFAFIIPGLLWAYFYISILLGQQDKSGEWKVID